MMPHRVDPQLSAIAAARPANRVLRWQPVQPELTLFMSDRTTCTVCQWAREAAGLPRDRRLHVKLSGNILTVTEIEDLHRPGRRLIAAHCDCVGTLKVYRLTGSRVDNDSVVPAAGMATLRWLGGRHRLTILGVAEGFKSHGDVLIDAIEDVC